MSGVLLCCCRGVRRTRQWNDARCDREEMTPGVIAEVSRRRDWDARQQNARAQPASSTGPDGGYEFRVSCERRPPPEMAPDRTGAARTHLLAESISTMYERNSAEPVGYPASACSLPERRTPLATAGERRGRVASDGDTLEGGGRPQSGAFSESEVEWSVEAETAI